VLTGVGLGVGFVVPTGVGLGVGLLVGFGVGVGFPVGPETELDPFVELPPREPAKPDF